MDLNPLRLLGDVNSPETWSWRCTFISIYGKILITFAQGVEKSISPLIIWFNSTIGMCVRDTFPVCCLKWIDVPPEYIEVVKDVLHVTSAINSYVF